MNLPSRLYISTRFARHFSHGYTTFRSGRFGLSRFGLANSVWPFRSQDISVATFLYIRNWWNLLTLLR